MTIGCTIGMSRVNTDTSTDANTNCRQQTNADEKRQRSIFCTAALDILQVRENAKKALDRKLVWAQSFKQRCKSIFENELGKNTQKTLKMKTSYLSGAMHVVATVRCRVLGTWLQLPGRDDYIVKTYIRKKKTQAHVRVPLSQK